MTGGAVRIDDLGFAGRVSSGDAEACGRFVNDFSSLVLSRIDELMRTHCHVPARARDCCLVLLGKQLKGRAVEAPPGQCDECMDSYIWFFDFLKGKARAYRGDNGCRFPTFVWSLVHARTTYLEWLRWRYGRAY